MAIYMRKILYIFFQPVPLLETYRLERFRQMKMS